MFTAKQVARILNWTLGKLYRRVKKGLKPQPVSLRPMLFAASEVADALTQKKVRFTRKHEKRGRKKRKYPLRAKQKKNAAAAYEETARDAAERKAKRHKILKRYGLLRWGG